MVTMANACRIMTKVDTQQPAFALFLLPVTVLTLMFSKLLYIGTDHIKILVKRLTTAFEFKLLKREHSTKLEDELLSLNIV